MIDVVFVLCVIGLFVAVVHTVVAATRWCGPVWFQRGGTSMAILALAVTTMSSQNNESIVVLLSESVVNNVSVVLTLIGAVVGGFGEVIWTLIHRGDKRFGDVMRGFVNS